MPPATQTAPPDDLAHSIEGLMAAIEPNEPRNRPGGPRWRGVLLAPGFVLTVSREGAGLFGQATGQQKVEMFPKSATLYLLKVVDAQIEFMPNAAGMVTSLILHQGGQHLPTPRIS